ncbi:phenylacetate--CoA ligase family protein [Christiangramia forsetii]|uniref:Phenylacetate-CoA ligase n=2 Tax=Christiangramia forsetii TaxID=411153 RepID=A0M1Y0_CHRFK|nr:AMP-binding protein [Christiangramia forsetii]GGG45083.1 phenylacetate--CoA ligase [Christiangramia forsetii]CAL66625.1 phenylacetate-CoA ligase [Christiangramia forsetii KT0803]
MSDHLFETLETIKTEQWKLFKKQLEYISENSPYYRKLFQEKSISIAEIKSFDDLRKLPITSKEDLQRYNSDFIAVPKDDIIDFVTTSGTLGSPVNFALNDADLDRLAENEYRSFKLAGVKKSDKVQITTTLDRRFMAGLAYFLGLRKLGAGIIRTGSGLPQLQWESIERFKPNYLVAVPSFLLKLIQYAEENNIDYKNSSIKAAVCIGEPLRNPDFELNALGRKITGLWDIELFSTYASTEMSTAFTECPEHHGNHVLTDLIHAEIVNEQGEQVKPGEIGELVVTPLGTQTMPLLRFATGDMLTYHESKCSCGRRTPRLGSVIGRKQQKIKLKGTSLYPQHIIEVLNSYGKIASFVIEAHLDEMDNDHLIIFVPNSFTAIEDLKDYFRSHLSVTPEIKILELENLVKLKFPKGSRKPQVFRDLR